MVVPCLTPSAWSPKRSDCGLRHPPRGSVRSPMPCPWSLPDLTPLGRQEHWEDSPKGYPQIPPYQWWLGPVACKGAGEAQRAEPVGGCSAVAGGEAEARGTTGGGEARDQRRVEP